MPPIKSMKHASEANLGFTLPEAIALYFFMGCIASLLRSARSLKRYIPLDM